MNLLRTCCALLVVFAASRVNAQKSVEITFESGDATIAGTLYLPEGKGPFPALISVHGSGPGTRDMKIYHSDREVFVPEGVAVFLYDKRGLGESTGSFDETLGIGVLVDDVLAAAKALRARPEIDAKKIGLKGISQGGWVVTMAGAKDPSLAFVVSVSGPGVNPLDQGIYQRGQILLDQGVSLQTVEKVNALRREVWRYYATGQGYEQADAAWESAKKEPWFVEAKLSKDAKVTTPEELAKPERGFYRNANFDMVPVVASYKVPVLAVFGAKDRYIPVLESVARWQEAIEAGKVKDATVRIFEDGGHGINFIEGEFPKVLVGEEHLQLMHEKPIVLVPSYKDFLVGWVKARL